MGIVTQLRNESGEVLEEVNDLRNVLSHACSSQFSDCRLLKYLVPWGDAVFNQAQAEDLSRDVREIREKYAGTALASFLQKIEPLVDRLASEVTAYLWFVGD